MTRYHDDEAINTERGTINGVAHRCLRCGFVGVGGTLEAVSR